MKNIIAVLIVGLCAMACDQRDCCGFEGDGPGNVTTGKWLLYERGYSPGSGYITEAVPEDPPQTLTFHSDGTMLSTIGAFELFHFYTFATGTSPDVYEVRFYKEDPTTLPDPVGSAVINHATFQNNTLKLTNPGCIEGCHNALKRID